VHRQITIRRLFAIAVIAALVLAPLSRPAMAGPAADASMAGVAGEASTAMAMDGMSMPCCPAEAPAPIDCDKCVFMALCKSQCVAGLSTASFRLPVAPSSAMARLQNDSWPEGLGHPPPEYPPRRLA
jgi:hypothetical protein